MKGLSPMAIELNSSALNAFRELRFENANAIVNLDNNGSSRMAPTRVLSPPYRVQRRPRQKITPHAPPC